MSDVSHELEANRPDAVRNRSHVGDGVEGTMARSVCYYVGECGHCENYYSCPISVIKNLLFRE